MATYRRRGGKWRAEIVRLGVRRSETFDTKTAAVAWATRIEAEILAGSRGDIPNLLFRAILERYESIAEVKKGRRWELTRLNALGRDRIASVPLRRLDTPHVSEWRDRRLKQVSRATVRREWNLLSHACSIAVREWKWLKANPFRAVKRPSDGRPRNRIATEDEIKVLKDSARGELRKAIVVALETGMRASEIPRAEVRGRVAYLEDTKNGEFREVPLSILAVENLSIGVNLTAGSITELFGRLCEETGIEGLTFHDLRRTAATRLSKVLDPWELCKMFGWKDPRIALNTYYRLSAEEVAKKL